MSDSKQVNVSVGPGALGLLGVVFVVLKLTGVISWSWVWVTAPFWSGIALWLVVFVVAFILLLLAEAFRK